MQDSHLSVEKKSLSDCDIILRTTVKIPLDIVYEQHESFKEARNENMVTIRKIQLTIFVGKVMS